MPDKRIQSEMEEHRTTDLSQGVEREGEKSTERRGEGLFFFFGERGREWGEARVFTREKEL